MEIPTARIMREDSYRMGYTQVRPYRYYYAAISPFRRLEINLRITEALDNPAFEQSTGRDKAFDVRYQFLSEGRYLPAFTIGFMDPHGTRIYPSQYIVASKQIYPFDFTVGFGNGWFGKEPLPPQGEGIKLEIFSDTKEWLRQSQVFWGVQFAPSDKFALMFEYSPIKYHKQIRDPAQKNHFREPVPSKYNFGIRYKPTKWSEIDLSYQRGSEIGLNASMGFEIGNPLIPIYEAPYREPPAYGTSPLSERITSALHYSGFSDIHVSAEGNELRVEAENEKYFYPAGGIGAVLDIIDRTAPDSIGPVHILIKENGVPLVEMTTTMADIHELYSGKFSAREFLYLSGINTDISLRSEPPGRHKKRFRYGIRPSIETFLNDPSGFFKYRLGLSGWLSYHPWRGATLNTMLEGYPVNNISTSNEPLSIPVRSDLVLYKKEKVSLGRLLFDQIYKMNRGLYGKVSAGLLEIQYAGIDAEAAMPLIDGRILIGISGSVVKKRDPDRPFKLKDDPVKDLFTTAFFNARLNIPEENIAVDIKAGRFLAGDPGVRFTLSKFINGVIIKAWYSITDTSDFTDPVNEGYNDKGLSISVPVRMFTGAESKTSYHYSLTPWTRDTGQDIEHFGTLFDFIGRHTKIFIDKERKMLYR